MKAFRLSLCVMAFLTVASPAGWARTLGSGKVINEKRPAAAVKSVDLAGIGDLTIVQGEAEGLSIDAEDNVLPLLETKVEGGALRIGLKGDVAPTKPVRMQLMVKALDSVQLSGSGKIHAEKLTAAGTLNVKLVGSGNIDLKGVECAKWVVALTGSGDVQAAGHAKEQTVEVTGSGDYEGYGLETGAADVTVSGSGDCEVSAKDKLNVTISGSGDVDYQGSPAVTKKVSGSGVVSKQRKPAPGAAADEDSEAPTAPSAWSLIHAGRTD